MEGGRSGGTGGSPLTASVALLVEEEEGMKEAG